MKKKLKMAMLMTSIFCTQVAKAQNLVPNPSFEEVDTCPDNIGQISRSHGWISFSESPDYFTACGTPNLFSVPNNGFGYQLAATGNSYCGLVAYQTQGRREYIGCSLSSPLEIGEQYYVSFKVNHPNWNESSSDWILSNKMGMHFSTVLYNENNPIAPNNLAQIYTDQIVDDSVFWFKIKGSFIADSSYLYIGIGNFFQNEYTDTISFPNANQMAYYYIDDVCISKSISICFNQTHPDIDDFQVFVNPLSNLLEINSYSNKLFECKLFTILGQLIFDKKFFGPKSNIDINSFAAGIYIVIIEDDNKKYVGKIFKI